MINLKGRIFVKSLELSTKESGTEKLREEELIRKQN